MKGLSLNGFADRIWALGLGSGALVTIGAMVAPAQELACPSLPLDRPGFNSIHRSTPQGMIQVIGRQPDQHYGVIVPADALRQGVLEQVQTCVPDAFWVESRLGSYIQSGFFYRRVEAEALSKALRSLRINARVVYYR